MLLEALAAKARERGGEYSYRELEKESGVNYSYVTKVKQGKIPSRAVIQAWSEALAPHFPYDEALVQAGYLPDDDSVREIVRRYLNAPMRLKRKVELELGLMLFSEERPRGRKKSSRKPAKGIAAEQQQPSDSSSEPEPCFA